MKLLKYRPIALALTFPVLLSACATNPDGTLKTDDRVIGAAIGAGAGCLLAQATGGKCIQGAAVGAALGFLVGWYFESQKVAGATEVNKEYATKGQRPPKNEVKPAAFSTQVKQSAPAATGEREVQMTSTTDLIGYGDKVPEVKQQYAIYDENNKLIETKTEKVAAVDGAGRYTTQSKFKVQPEAKDKKYKVETTLMVDNKAYKKNTYQVSFLNDGRMLLAGL